MSNLFMCLVILLAVSCTQSIELPLPNYESKLVLNGFICPDSLLQVHLSKSVPPAGGLDFPIVADAQVSLYENDILIEHLVYKGEGIYQSNIFPKAGYRYKIKVIKDYIEISAQDTVPSKPSFRVQRVAPRQNIKYFESFDIYLKDTVKAVYWISNILIDYKGISWSDTSFSFKKK